MRGYIINIIVQNLVAGHSVTVGCASQHQMAIAHSRIAEELKELGIEITKHGAYSLDLPSGARLQIVRLDRPSSSSVFHTPVVVVRDAKNCDPKLLADFYHVTCAFPNGLPPIYLEC